MFQVSWLVRLMVTFTRVGADVKVLLGIVNALPAVLPAVPKTMELVLVVVMVPLVLTIGVLPF